MTGWMFKSLANSVGVALVVESQFSHDPLGDQVRALCYPLESINFSYLLSKLLVFIYQIYTKIRLFTS